MKPTMIVLLIICVVTAGFPFAISGSNSEKTVALSLQDDEERHKEKKAPSVLKRFVSDHGRIWSAPFRLKGTRWLVWGGIALTTGVLIVNDEAIYRNIKDLQNETPWIDQATPFFSDLAQGAPFGIAGLFLLSGWVSGDKKLARTGSLSLQAMIHSFVIIQTIKHLTGRQRPSWDNGIDDWAGPAGFFKRYEAGQWARYDAFASGHTITIWSLATVIAHQYSRPFIIPLLSYTVATLSGLATVTDDLHWISDVLVGAVLGYAIGRFVVKRFHGRWSLTPIADRDRVGLSIGFGF